jgi:hypothetical protein
MEHRAWSGEHGAKNADYKYRGIAVRGDTNYQESEIKYPATNDPKSAFTL